jgi:hypothetical protein
MLSKRSDDKQFCTAVVLNRQAMLTTARCAQRMTVSQVSVEVTEQRGVALVAHGLATRLRLWRRASHEARSPRPARGRRA